jgi:hypothetical protein
MNSVCTWTILIIEKNQSDHVEKLASLEMRFLATKQVSLYIVFYFVRMWIFALRKPSYMVVSKNLRPHCEMQKET